MVVLFLFLNQTRRIIFQKTFRFFGGRFEKKKKIVEKNGPVDVLINNAGIFKSLAFSDLKSEDFEVETLGRNRLEVKCELQLIFVDFVFVKQQMKTNYLGTVYCTKSVVDSMKSRRTGRIVFISSQAGQIGIFGYTAYSPTKFALKGFCDCLQMELKPYNVRMTLVFPPDVDTPGLKEENKHKPLETKLLAEDSGVLKPEEVATKIIKALKVSSLCNNGSRLNSMIDIFCI